MIVQRVSRGCPEDCPEDYAASPQHTVYRIQNTEYTQRIAISFIELCRDPVSIATTFYILKSTVLGKDPGYEPDLRDDDSMNTRRICRPGTLFSVCV